MIDRPYAPQITWRPNDPTWRSGDRKQIIAATAGWTALAFFGATDAEEEAVQREPVIAWALEDVGDSILVDPITARGEGFGSACRRPDGTVWEYEARYFDTEAAWLEFKRANPDT